MSSVDHKQPHPLSLAALASWTALHPPSASTAVAAYLAQQAGRTYSPDVTPNSPSSTRSPPAPDRSRRHEHVEDVRETAMVLGGRDVRESDLAPKAPRGPKTATLVGAMKARTSTTLPLSPSKGIKKVQRDSSSSPFIAARNDARSTHARAEKENAPVAALAEGTSKDKMRRKREIVVVDPEPKPTSKRAKPVESDSSEQDVDAVARLAARKERRRSRALIVKDRTQTAAATGAAAASKVKKARRDSALARDESESEQEPVKVKKKRNSKGGMEEAKQVLHAQNRARNIADKRLTLPTVKLGLFSRGAASARIEVKGTRKSQLGFSELAFLNTPRPPPPPQSSTATSSLSPVSAVPLLETHPKPTVTYRSKHKRSKSKHFDQAVPAPPVLDPSDSHSSSSLDPPPPLPKRAAPSHPAANLRPLRQPAPMQDTVSMDPSASHLSEHSAYSRAQRRAEQGVEEGVVEPEMVIDTSLAWGGAANARLDVEGDCRRDVVQLPLDSDLQVEALVQSQSPSWIGSRPSPPSPPPRVESEQETTTAQPHSLDLIDRLIRACETGELEASLHNDSPPLSDPLREGPSAYGAPETSVPMCGSRSLDTQDWEEVGVHADPILEDRLVHPDDLHDLSPTELASQTWPDALSAATPSEYTSEQDGAIQFRSPNLFNSGLSLGVAGGRTEEQLAFTQAMRSHWRRSKP